MDLPGPVAAGARDVLAQSTRARAFALLGELRRPATTDELAIELGLHRNGARFHLERLEQAGLVERRRQRQQRGRPLDVWTVAASARPMGRAPRAYGDLSRWLARAIKLKAASPRGFERAGRGIGRELAPSATGDASAALAIALTALGFQPIEQSAGTFCLRNCPYPDAVHEDQPVICALHRGITLGLLDVLAPAARLTTFEPKDPDEAGCLIGVSGL